MFTKEQRKRIIEDTIRKSLMHKLSTYKPETINMPFHYRLLGKDRMALFSFIHSLNTTFGTSIFEPVAETIAKMKFSVAHKQFVVGDEISEEAQKVIQEIMNQLTISGNPNKEEEIKKIKEACSRGGKRNKLKTVKVDLFVKDNNGHIYLFDIKTPKPNMSNIKDIKRTLLEWVGIYLTKYPDAVIHSYIAIPYNPYEPKPYERWTLKGMIDFDNELMVAAEFWNFLGGENTYLELLDCFESVGKELRPKIDEYFSKFK